MQYKLKQKQLPYLSSIMNRDIKPTNWAKPREKLKRPSLLSILRGTLTAPRFSWRGLVIIVVLVKILLFFHTYLHWHFWWT